MSNLLNWDPENGFSGWTEWCPMPGLSPHFSVDSAGKQTSLCLRGGGNRHVFGAWCQRIPIQSGQTYQLEVNFRYQGMTDLMPYAKGVSAKTHDFDDAGNEIHSDFNRMVEIVRSAGYSGYVGIEYEGGGMSELEGIRATKALLERTFTSESM